MPENAGQRSRHRVLRLTGVAGGVLFVATALVNLLGRTSPLPPWLLVVSILGALAGLVQYVVEQRQRLREEREQARRQQDAARERERELAALVRWPPPLVSEVRPDAEGPSGKGLTPRRLGIHPNKYDSPQRLSPYVPRAIDAALDEALRSTRIILLVGPAAAGKSRSAFEALRRLQPTPRLLLPVPGRSLHTEQHAIERFFHLTPRPEWGAGPAVLWLDNVQRFVDGLSPSLLRALLQHEPPITVVATLEAMRYRLLRPEAPEVQARKTAGPEPLQVSSNAEALLEFVEYEGKVLWLEAALTEEAEWRRARELYPLEPEDGLRRGLGEQLVAAEELWRKFIEGKFTLPAGHALVQAAVDWRRAGLERPMPEGVLRELATSYLRELRTDLDLTDEVHERALKWAREPVGSHIALLSVAGEDAERGFVAFDHTVARVEGQRLPLPGKTWTFLLEHTSLEENLLIGDMAYLRKEVEVTEQACVRVRQSGQAHVVPQAALRLGTLRAERGDLAGARPYLQQAIDSGHADAAPRAAFLLGLYLADAGDLDGARPWLTRAAQSKHAEVIPFAALVLGQVLVEQQEEESAIFCFHIAILSGRPEVAPLASLLLGLLLQQRGEVADARLYLEEALESGVDAVVPQAAFALGVLLEQEGEVEGARASYQRALDSGDPDTAASAALSLGLLLKQQGDTEGARTAIQQALRCRSPAVTHEAKEELQALQGPALLEASGQGEHSAP